MPFVLILKLPAFFIKAYEKKTNKMLAIKNHKSNPY